MGKGERLSKYVEKQGFKKKEFCETFGLDYNTMVRIMADKMPMGIIVVDRIHNIFPQMNIHWLLYGEGPEELISNDLSVLNEPQTHYGKECPEFKKHLLEALEDIEVQKKIYEKFKPKK